MMREVWSPSTSYANVLSIRTVLDEWNRDLVINVEKFPYDMTKYIRLFFRLHVYFD